MRHGATLGGFSQLLPPHDAVVRRAQPRLEMPALAGRFVSGPALREIRGEVVGEAIREVDALARFVRVAARPRQLRLPQALDDSGARYADQIVESPVRALPVGEGEPRQHVELPALLSLGMTLDERDHTATTTLLQNRAQLVLERLIRVFGGHGVDIIATSAVEPRREFV